ncbi:hypothetical protein PRIPAC_91069 [Pristionchus pacificus]|uniref:Uncharacterized protein n=1 Tax=Pristionchus pacificus TaxID=54126 RepID=A0A2A6B7B4_PRIPA|nr:hypothetical protein PRIPAC_91069 [Pristionchus pacificus]|eukprot:PDM61743.1 hypothetical protein PRIPAC_51185 [Pristionchus pacificus]
MVRPCGEVTSKRRSNWGPQIVKRTRARRQSEQGCKKGPYRRCLCWTLRGRSHPKYGPTGDRRLSIALVPEGSQNRTVKRDLIGELRAGRCGYVSLLDSNLWEWGT